MTNGRKSRLAPSIIEGTHGPLQRRAGDEFASRGKHGLSLGSPPPRAITQTPETLAIAAEEADSLEARRNERQRLAIKGAVASAVGKAIDELLSPKQAAVMRAVLQAQRDENNGARRWTWQDIATKLGMHIDTVKTHYRRGKDIIGKARPAWREMFPTAIFCDAPDLFANILEQRYEERKLDDGRHRFADDRIESQEDWSEEHGHDPQASNVRMWTDSAFDSLHAGTKVAGLQFSNDRGRHGDVSRESHFTAETVAHDDPRHIEREEAREVFDEKSRKWVAEKKPRKPRRYRRRPGIPTHINKDMHIGSLDHFDAVCRAIGQRLKPIKKKDSAAQYVRPRVRDDEFREALRAYDTRLTQAQHERRTAKRRKTATQPNAENERQRRFVPTSPLVRGGPPAFATRDDPDPRRGFAVSHEFKNGKAATDDGRKD